MTLTEKKVEGIGIDYAIEYIQEFIGKQTVNTGKAYRTALKLFFKEVYDKEPEFVTIKDLKNTRMLDIAKYHRLLNDKYNYKINTVNKHFKGVKSFFKFVGNDIKEIDNSIFNGVNLKKPELDAKGWDGLTWKEAKMVWEYAQDSFGEEGNQIAMLFKLASITSIRLDALISSEWEKNWFVKEENGVDINYIEVIDKKQVHKKPVSTKFYNELREKLGTTGKLFPDMHPNKVGNKLQEALNSLGFDSRRNIKFHSLKKTGVMRALELTGSMYKAQEQGNHKSIMTTEKYYLQYKECMSEMTSYYMDEEIDIKDELEKLSKDQLVEAILKMDDGSKIQLINILKG